ncbi:MAG: hypothetical protein COA78_21235 [Blastopirellula sp.]|nr:MAG: hypothetical protein COA78_21235 [Blastopirellula sp.]
MSVTTEEIIKEWVYVSNTEANGKYYYDEKSDRAAVVYMDKTKVFSGRREGIKGNFPACYEDLVYI